MPAVRGLTISVGYCDILAITLPRNLRHFTECVVVTSPDDARTQEVARSVPGVRLSITDAFTRPGSNGVVPRFNKGLGMEEGGFDFMGREGWICIFDADILFPPVVPFDLLQAGYLYGARRRVLADATRWRPHLDWRNCPVHKDGGPVGFFQCFNADDPAIRGRLPWYDVTFPHAGGGDAKFMRMWPRSHWKILNCDTLHLGQVDQNWFGCDQEGRDLMAKFVRDNGWKRAMHLHKPEAAARAGEIPGRVEVPGYGVSSFELPFVQRARGETPDRQ